MPDSTTYDAFAVSLRVKGEATFDQGRLRRKLTEPNTAALLRLVHKVQQQTNADWRRKTLAGLTQAIEAALKVEEVPTTTKPQIFAAFKADVEQGLDLLIGYANARLDEELQKPGSQLSRRLGEIALQPSKERVRGFLTAAVRQTAGFLREGSAKYKEYPAQCAREQVAAFSPNTVPQNYGTVLQERMESLVKIAESGISQHVYDLDNDEELNMLDAPASRAVHGGDTPYTLKAEPQEVVQNILAYPETQVDSDYDRSYTSEDEFIARTVRSLNQKSQALRTELEHEVEDMVEDLYPGVRVRATVRFRQGSIEIIATMMLTWAGGIVIDTTQEYFESQLKEIITVALDRVWSRFTSLVGLTEYISPTEVEIKSMNSRPLRESAMSRTNAADGAAHGGNGRPAAAVDEILRTMSRREALMLLLLGLILLFVLMLLASQYYTVAIQPRP